MRASVLSDQLFCELKISQKDSLLKNISNTDNFWSSFNMSGKYLAKLIKKKGKEEEVQAAGKESAAGMAKVLVGNDSPTTGLETESWDSTAVRSGRKRKQSFEKRDFHKVQMA